MTPLTALCLLLAAGPGFTGSERAALNLAIAATREAPPDLAHLIVQHRKDYLGGVMEEIHRAPAAEFSLEAKALSRSILERTPMSEVIHRCGRMVGEVLTAEAPRMNGAEEAAAFESAAAGPYRFPGLAPASSTGNPSAAAASIARAAEDIRGSKMSPDAIASRIVTDATNLLWAIWTGAGGDARPAKNFDERNGPYTIPGAPR